VRDLFTFREHLRKITAANEAIYLDLCYFPRFHGERGGHVQKSLISKLFAADWHDGLYSIGEHAHIAHEKRMMSAL